MVRPEWATWRPNTDSDILAHYYANSDGAALPSFVTGIVNGLAAGLTGGASVVATAVTSNVVAKAAQSQRSKLDSPAEKQRIVQAYRQSYAQYSNWRSEAYAIPITELDNRIQAMRSALQTAKNKCQSRDTAGCRSMGFIALSIQWFETVKAVRSGATMQTNSGIASQTTSTNLNSQKSCGFLCWILNLFRI